MLTQQLGSDGAVSVRVNSSESLHFEYTDFCRGNIERIDNLDTAVIMKCGTELCSTFNFVDYTSTS